MVIVVRVLVLFFFFLENSGNSQASLGRQMPNEVYDFPHLLIRRIPFQEGIPDGLIPFSMIHFSCPSLYSCTSLELSDGTGGDIFSAKGTPVASPSSP